MTNRHEWVAAGTRVVEAIRSAYVREPWTTAAGLALRFGVPVEDGVAAVVGGWLGMDSLTSGTVASNLARARMNQRAAIQRSIMDQGNVRVEWKLAGVATKKKRRNPRVTRARQLRKNLAQHRATYEPIVGASLRRACKLAWIKRREKPPIQS